MSTFMYVILGLGIAVVVYGAVAAVLAIRVILKKRDGDYRARYAEFLEHERAVRSRLKESEKND